VQCGERLSGGRCRTFVVHIPTQFPWWTLPVAVALLVSGLVGSRRSAEGASDYDDGEQGDREDVAGGAPEADGVDAEQFSPDQVEHEEDTGRYGTQSQCSQERAWASPGCG